MHVLRALLALGLLLGGTGEQPLPRFICTPLPPGHDACEHEASLLHEDLHEEPSHARATVLRLREALVQQRETALELAAKLRRCRARLSHEDSSHEEDLHEEDSQEDLHEDVLQRALQGLRQRLQQLQHGPHGNQHGSHGDHEKHGKHHEGLHGNHHGHHSNHHGHHSDQHGPHGDHGKAGEHSNHHSIFSSNQHGPHGNHSKGGEHSNHHDGHHGNQHSHHGDQHSHHSDHSKAGKAHGLLSNNQHGYHGDRGKLSSEHHGSHGNQSKPGDPGNPHSILPSNAYGHHGNGHGDHSKVSNLPFEDHHGNQAARLHGNHHYGNHGNHHGDHLHGNQGAQHPWGMSGHRHGNREEEEEDHDDPEDHGDAQGVAKGFGVPRGGFRVSFPLRTNYMFARARGTVRRALRALSACLWLRPGGAPALGTPFSYAAPGQPNELVLLAWGGRPMELLVDDQAVALSLSPSPGRWHHVCVTWAAAGGTWSSFQDGVPRARGGGLAVGHPLRPRGVLVLGQEQDALGGGFDATQAFVGEISEFHLWSRVLDAAEVAAVAGCRAKTGGDLLAWAEGGLELHGGVTTLPFQPCP